MGDVFYNESLFRHGIPEDELHNDPTYVEDRILHRLQEGGYEDFVDVPDNAVGRVEAIAMGTSQVYEVAQGMEFEPSSRTWMLSGEELLLAPSHVEERTIEDRPHPDEDAIEAYGTHRFTQNGDEETAEHCSEEEVRRSGKEMTFTEEFDNSVLSKRFDADIGTQLDLAEPEDELPQNIARFMSEDVAIGSFINGTDCYNIRMRYNFTRDWDLGFVKLLSHWRHDQELAGNFCPNLNNLDWYFQTIRTTLGGRFKVTYGCQRIIVEMAGWGAQYVHHQTTAPSSWYVRSMSVPGDRVLSSYFKCRHAAKHYGEHRSKSTCTLCGCIVKIQDAGFSRTATWIRHVEDGHFMEVYSSVQDKITTAFTKSIMWIADHLKNCPHDHGDDPVGGIDSAYAETSECYAAYDKVVMEHDLVIMSHARHKLSVLTHHAEEIILSAGYIDVTGTGAGYSNIAGDTLDCRTNKPGHPFVLNW
jgi:hypothetical protein